MMLILTVLVVLAILIASELWWHIKRPHDEFSRKFIHITVGSFGAFWPYFLTWKEIRLLSVAFIFGVIISQSLNVFKAIHSVERPTWGEIFFAVAVGALTFVTQDAFIYTVAVLHMGFADGLAAIYGTLYGKKNSYKVFGHTKSIAGSAVFLLCSLAILIVYATVQPHVLSPFVLVGLAAAATVLENFAVRGLDNLLVPLLVALVLQSLR